MGGMRLSWIACALALTAALASGCMERTTAAPPPTARVTDVEVPDWQYVSSFGGNAQLVQDSPDPYAKRYEDGKFLLLSGIDTTDSEVWACDLVVSRLQRFDHEGKLLSTFGSGAPVKDTLPSDKQMFTEAHTIDLAHELKWEQKPEGQRWVTDKAGLFRAADVAIGPTGFWLADQSYTSGTGAPIRPASIRFYGNDGTQFEMPLDSKAYWPGYLAFGGDNTLAFTEEHGNVLWTGRFDTTQHAWEVKRPGQDVVSFDGVMRVLTNAKFSSEYQTQLDHAENAGTNDDQFNGIGGVAFFNGKLLVCDRKNLRLKVYEARSTSDPSTWSKLLKIVPARKAAGALRFLSPRDVAVSKEGLVYVLDGERKEIAILSPNFERIGTIEGAHFSDPRAISLTPNGRRLFVSDPGSNMIHRYDVR